MQRKGQLAMINIIFKRKVTAGSLQGLFMKEMIALLRGVGCVVIVAFEALNLSAGVWPILSAGKTPGIGQNYDAALTRLLQNTSYGAHGFVNNVQFYGNKKTYVEKMISGPSSLFANEIGNYGILSMKVLTVDGRTYDSEMLRDDFSDYVLLNGELTGGGRVEESVFEIGRAHV